MVTIKEIQEAQARFGEQCTQQIKSDLYSTGTNNPQKLTIAQSIRRSSDPYRAAITSFTSRDIIRSEDGQKDKKIFHFEDTSFLTFEVSYLAVEDGGGQ